MSELHIFISSIGAYFSNLLASWLASVTWVTFEFPCTKTFSTQIIIISIIEIYTAVHIGNPLDSSCSASQWDYLPWRWFDPIACSGSQFLSPCRWPCCANCRSLCSLGSYSLPFHLPGRPCWFCWREIETAQCNKTTITFTTAVEALEGDLLGVSETCSPYLAI